MIQGKCPLISIPLIKKSMSPWKTSPSAAVSFLQTDCVFGFQPGELGFWSNRVKHALKWMVNRYSYCIKSVSTLEIQYEAGDICFTQDQFVQGLR